MPNNYSPAEFTSEYLAILRAHETGNLLGLNQAVDHYRDKVIAKTVKEIFRMVDAMAHDCKDTVSAEATNIQWCRDLMKEKYSKYLTEE